MRIRFGETIRLAPPPPAARGEAIGHARFGREGASRERESGLENEAAGARAGLPVGVPSKG